jgi:hypothetical protein
VVEGKDLDGVALFIGMNYAVAVCSHGVRRNSVHYWDILPPFFFFGGS